MEAVPPFALMPFLTFADAIFLREASHSCRRHFKLAAVMSAAERQLINCLSKKREDAELIVKTMKEEGLLLVGNKVWAVLFDLIATMYKPVLVRCSIGVAVPKEKPVMRNHPLSKIATVSIQKCSPARLRQLGEHAIVASTWQASCRKNSIRYVGGKMIVEISDRNTLKRMFTMTPGHLAYAMITEIQACESQGFTLLRSSFMDT